MLIPNICFGYRIKMLKVNSPGTELIRIKNNIYKKFLTQEVAFKWSEKEMREALDAEI